MIERDKEYYNKKISVLYSIIENQEKIIRDLQEKIILLKAAEPMLELTKEYGEKDLYKQRIDKANEILNEGCFEYDNCPDSVINEIIELKKILGDKE